MKKGIKILGISTLGVLALLLIIPFFLKGRVLGYIRTQVNKNINASFDVESGSISLIKNFPLASVTLRKVTLANHSPFEGDTLLCAEDVTLSMSIKELFSLGKKPLSIKSFQVDNADINIVIDQNGLANYDIVNSSDNANSVEKPSSTGSEFVIDLNHYSFNNIDLVYKDYTIDMSLFLENLNHSGKGDLSANRTKLDTKSESIISFNYDSISYLARQRIALDAVIDMDFATNRYSFLKNEGYINQLPLEFQGYIQLLEDGQEVHVDFQTPSTDFKNFLALIPEYYSSNIEGVNTSGNFDIQGKIDGKIDSTHIPKFAIKINSDNASFKYPDLPKRVDHIFLDLAINNETGIAQDSYISISKLSFQIDEDRFNMDAKLLDLLGNTKINSRMDGIINLSNLAQAYPIPEDYGLSGILKADLSADFHMNTIKNQAYQDANLEGIMNLSDFNYNSESMIHPVRIEETSIAFNPSVVTLNSFKAKTGDTDINATGKLSNFLGYIFNNELLKGTLTLRSQNFDLNDIMVKNTPGSDEGNNKVSAPEEMESFKVPTFLDCEIDVAAETFIYDDLSLENVHGQMKIRDGVATLSQMKSDLFSGKLGLNGSISTQTDHPTFGFSMTMDEFDVSESFTQLELLNKLAPIAKMLDGKLNSNISFGGNLNQDMTPILGSLSGDFLAHILTKNIKAKESPVVQALSEKLSFIYLKNIDLEDVKTHISFEDGRVAVKPFVVMYKDIPITISGTHSFDQIMEYTAQFDVPAKYLGNEVNQLLSQIDLEKQTENISVPVTADISGKFSSPQVSTNLKSAVSNLTNKLIEIKKQQLLDEGKEKADNLLEDLIAQNSNRRDSTNTAAEIKEIGKSLLGEIGISKKTANNSSSKTKSDSTQIINDSTNIQDEKTTKTKAKKLLKDLLGG